MSHMLVLLSVLRFLFSLPAAVDLLLLLASFLSNHLTLLTLTVWILSSVRCPYLSLTENVLFELQPTFACGARA